MTIGFRKIKIIRQSLDGGYVAHTLGKAKLASVDAYTYAHWFHQPYETDFNYAIARGIGAERRTKNVFASTF